MPAPAVASAVGFAPTLGSGQVTGFNFLVTSLPSGATLTRASANGTYFDSSGVLQTVGANVARFTYSPTTLLLRGLLVEPSRTNSLPNNTGTGAVAGSPGTLPTGIIITGGTGGTRTIAGPSVESGIEYWDITYTGVVTSTIFINLMDALGAAAASGQTWQGASYVKLAGGSLAGISQMNLRVSERNSGGAETANTSVTFTPTTAGLATQLITVSRTFNQATTTGALTYFRIVPDTVTSWNVTFRIGLPTLSRASDLSSVIETTNAAGTRAQDVLTLAITEGVYNISIVRESGTTSLTGVYCPGSFVVPTDVSPVQSVTFTRTGSTPLDDYYIDSVSGSDSNYGTSEAQAWRNLTKLPSLSATNSIGLKAASSWSNQTISSTADGIILNAYGTGAKPIINGTGATALCVSLTGDNVSVSGISATDATDNNGCIIVGDNATVDDVEASVGTLHTLLIASGTLSNSSVYDGDNGGSSFSLIEGFTTTDGATLTLSDNQIYMTAYDADCAGLDFHTSGGAVTYASVTSERNAYTDLGSGFSGSDCDMRYSTDDVFDGCLVAYTISGDAVITNPTDINGVATGVFMSINAANATVILDGGTICREAFNTSVITSSQTGLTFTAKGPLKIGANSVSVFTVFFFDYGDITIGEAGVTQEYDTANINYIGILGRGANNLILSTPGNYIFSTATFKLEINGVTYNNLADMQAAGYFTNATVGTVTAC